MSATPTDMTARKARPNIFARLAMRKESEAFLENLASLLAAGIPILEALESLSAEIRSHTLQAIIVEMRTRIENGMSLSDTLERSGLFAPHVSALLRLGEQSGTLVQNIGIIAIEDKKRRAISSKVRSATMYPVFVLVLTSVIGIGTAWFILPKLALVFDRLDITLPLVTQVLINLGLFLSEYGVYVVPACIVLVGILGYFVFFYHKTKGIGEHMLFCVPGLRQLLKESEITRLGYLLGTLHNVGLSPTDALRSLGDATPFYRYRTLYYYAAQQLEEGNSFKKCFASYKNTRKLIPVAVQQLIVAGEQSGTLSKTLLDISETYEKKTNTTAKNLTVMLEPVLLVVVWLGVVAVAMAIILPIYSLVGQFNTR